MAERYDCKKSLNGYKERFPSLQCDMVACGGHEGDREIFETHCLGCEKYIVNRQQKDWDDVDRPISRDSQH